MSTSTPYYPFYYLALSFLLLFSCSGSNTEVDRVDDMQLWLTTGDEKHLFEQMPGLAFAEVSGEMPVITVDTSVTYQTMDGFGYSLTGGSAYHLNQSITAEQRKEILNELFSTEGNGIGISYLRISIGASDLDEQVFSYNDLPDGETDLTLEKFDLSPDRKNLIPVLKEILAINPDIKIMGSPWSSPAWMKDNKSPKGGKLKPEYYEVYANYFVRYIQEMANEGIVIDAITPQNEPENPKNNPSLVMTAEEQTTFIKNHLGPAFENAGIKTKIVVFDHNCDHPEYPITILNDTLARTYIDGTAFHLYLGDIEALSQVQQAHPDKNLYFTEQWTSPQGTFDGDLRWHTRHLVVGAPRNWSRTVLEWNLAADPEFQPHTDDGGCTMCLGALTIGDAVITRNVAYYIIAHASKFVRPGSVRIDSNIPEDLFNVAFVTPSGKKVLIVVNDGNHDQHFVIDSNGKKVQTMLQAGAVGTYVW